MNFSNPILICDENVEFRILVRDMLTKNGFFHIVEASNENEAREVLSNKKELVAIKSQLENQTKILEKFGVVINLDEDGLAVSMTKSVENRNKLKRA